MLAEVHTCGVSRSRGPNTLLVGLLAVCVAVAGLAVAGFEYWAEHRATSCQVQGIEGPVPCARTDMLARMRAVDFVVVPRDAVAVVAALAIAAMFAVIVGAVGRSARTAAALDPQAARAG